MDEFPLIGERWASLEGGETVGVEGKSKQSTLPSLMATVGLSIRAQAFVVMSRAELPQPQMQVHHLLQVTKMRNEWQWSKRRGDLM